MREPIVLLIANIQSASGKSISTACIAASYAAAGRRTLIVDTPGGDCGDIFFSNFLAPRHDPGVHLHQGENIVFQTSIEGLELCCSNNHLMRELLHVSREGIDVDEVDLGAYDCVLIDTLPNSNPYQTDRPYLYYLLSLSQLLIPLSAEYVSHGGLRPTLYYYLKSKKYMSSIRFLGGFLNRIDTEEKVSNSLEEDYRDKGKDKIFESVIHYSQDLKTVTSTILLPDNYPTGLQNEYADLTNEIIRRMENRNT